MRIAVHVTIMVMAMARNVHLAILVVAMPPAVEVPAIGIAVHVAMVMIMPVCIWLDVLGLLHSLPWSRVQHADWGSLGG